MTEYVNPVPTVDAVLTDPYGNILFGVRATDPHKGKLNLPGGFLEVRETLEGGLLRELKEELGLDSLPLKYANSRYENVLREGNWVHQISVVFKGRIDAQPFTPNEEVSVYVWIHPRNLYVEDVTTAGEYDAIMAAIEEK